jgi:hypothetical protein
MYLTRLHIGLAMILGALVSIPLTYMMNPHSSYLGSLTVGMIGLLVALSAVISPRRNR